MQYEQYEHGYLKYGMVNPLPGGLVVISLIVQLHFHITSLHVPPGVGVLLAVCLVVIGLIVQQPYLITSLYDIYHLVLASSLLVLV